MRIFDCFVWKTHQPRKICYILLILQGEVGSIGRQGIKGDAGAKVSAIAASSKSFVQDNILLLVLHV